MVINYDIRENGMCGHWGLLLVAGEENWVAERVLGLLGPDLSWIMGLSWISKLKVVPCCKLGFIGY